MTRRTLACLVAAIVAGCMAAGADKKIQKSDMGEAGATRNKGLQAVTVNVPFERFPQRLKQHAAAQPLQDGFINITQPPYNAKGDGAADDTDAIQQAIHDAYSNNLAVFFPPGTYLVSRQIECIQRMLAGATQKKFAHILTGSTKGARAPVIKLKDNSTVKNNILLYFQFFTDQGKAYPPAQYLATFRGIDIDMGDNPTADAISMSGAQHCVIENVVISGNFDAGINGLPGSGGGVVNVRIVGGKIGVLQDEYRPNPTLTGVVLERQSQCGVKVLDARGPVVLTGFRIVGPDNPSKDYRAVFASNEKPTDPKLGFGHAKANLCLADGTIEVNGPTGIAIFNQAQDTVINNVYVKAATIIETGIHSAKPISGDSNAWKRISLYAFTSSLDKGTISVEGRDYSNRSSDVQYCAPLEDKSPQEDFVVKHIWGNMPSWEDAALVNIVKDYGATPENINDRDDDGPAIQKAIDDTTTRGHANFGKTVFIPRGYFHVKTPIILKRGTRLIGAAKNISCLKLREDWESVDHAAAVESVNDAEGNIVLSDFEISGFMHAPLLRIKSGNTIIRDLPLETERHSYWKKAATPDRPYAMFSDNAGGKVYHLCISSTALWEYSDFRKNRKTASSSPGPVYPGYYLLHISNTHQPLSFYQISIEHLISSPHVMMENVENVDFFGLKFEADPGRELLRIKNSKNIRIMGGAGNWGLCYPNDRAIVTIEKSTHLLFANLNRKQIQDELKDKAWILVDDAAITDAYPVTLFRH